MIRRLLFLFTVSATAVATFCFAQGVTPLSTNPYYVASHCEFNPGSGANSSAAVLCNQATTKESCETTRICWWRDTTNQNAISQHTADEFTDEVKTLYTSSGLDVYVYSTPFSSNVVLLTTPSCSRARPFTAW